MQNNTENTNQSDSELFQTTRNLEVSDIVIPENETDEIPSFIDDKIEEDNPTPEKEELISKREVDSSLNRLRLNEPTAEIITNLMNIFIPLLICLIFKNSDKDDFNLSEEEKETLVSAWANYLATQNVNISPGATLITTILTIYGAKITMAMWNKSISEKKITKLKEENEQLKRIHYGEKDRT